MTQDNVQLARSYETAWFNELVYSYSGAPRIDRAGLEQAFHDLYAFMDMTPPQLLVCDSPAACIEAMQAMDAGPVARARSASLGQQVWDRIWPPFQSRLQAQLGEVVWEYDAYRNSTHDMFTQDFWRPHRLLIDGLRRQLHDRLAQQFSDWAYLDESIAFSANDLCWISFGSYSAWVGGLLDAETCRDLAFINAIRYQCDWWWPFEGVVVVSERPVFTEWDFAHRLHCDNGPAVKFGDGFELFSWHGCNVPERWITDRARLDANDVLQHAGAMTRMAGMSIIGWDIASNLLEWRLIDAGLNGAGQLMEVTVSGVVEPSRFLRAQCPYDGPVFEVVPRISDIDGLPIETAIAAQAWRSNCAQAEYHLI